MTKPTLTRRQELALRFLDRVNVNPICALKRANWRIDTGTLQYGRTKSGRELAATLPKLEVR